MALLLISDNLVFPLQPRSTPSTLKCFALRLGPGEEIKSRLQEFVKRHDLQAAFVLSCVGSVERAKIRLAHATAINSTNEVSIFDMMVVGGTLPCPHAAHIENKLGGSCMGTRLRTALCSTEQFTLPLLTYLHHRSLS